MAEMMDLYNEAENSVLGTLIADAEVNASLVFTRVRPEDFVTGISRQIFETCRAMYGRGDVIDPLTVKAACGSEFATWLKELEQITPSARYCGAYVDKLLELSRRYRLQKLFREALDGNFAGMPMEELIGKIECMNNVVADDNDQRSSTMTDLLTDFYGRMGTERQYLDWGFDELNRYVKVNPKHYVVVGARPSAGKTAFALQVALHILVNSEDNTVRIAQGINSMTTTDGKTKTEDMQFIETVEAMDMMKDDIAATFRETYLGNYRNSRDNQMMLVAALNSSYFRQLMQQNILDPDYANAAAIDTDAQRAAWVASGKSEAADWDDDTVKANPFKRTVYLAANVKILGSMTDLIFPITMA